MKIKEGKRISELPPYMFGVINDEKLRLRQNGVDVIGLGMGNPDTPPADHIIDKLCDAAKNPRSHGYSASRGIKHLRTAICQWYEKRFGVCLDPENEAIVTIGSKEGISHLTLATLNKGDVVLLQNPTYPAYSYSIAIAEGKIFNLPINEENNFIPDLDRLSASVCPNPKMIIVSYPHNPTTQVVTSEFFEKLVRFAKRRNVIVVHDIAYSELCFDGYRAPSFLETPGAKDVGIEFYSLSKTYSMAGWRVGFVVGNRELVGALARIKGYYDYGIFTPIQVASIAALEGGEEHIENVRGVYQRRRDVFVSGLNRIGWTTPLPKATMYVWARIPERFRKLGSMKFSSMLLRDGNVAVSPGIGFGKDGDEYVRFALVENEGRLRQAIRGIKKVLSK